MAEQIKMLFGVNTRVDPWNIVLDGGLDLPTERGRLNYYGTAETTLEFLSAHRWQAALTKTAQN